MYLPFHREEAIGPVAHGAAVVAPPPRRAHPHHKVEPLALGDGQGRVHVLAEVQHAAAHLVRVRVGVGLG